MLTHALHASFADVSEQRASDRRVLRLEAQAATQMGEGGIQIHNLSRTGMLACSTAEVPIGSGVEVEMPGGTRHRAEVVWRDANLFGCRFKKPLSQATLSAALLRAAPLASTPSEAALVVDNQALARLREHWDFEQDALSPDRDMPPGARMWAIIGLGLLSWAVPSAIVAWVLW